MISAENLVRIYKTAETEVVALHGLDVEVANGELMAIIGNSGSGKSTLMNIIGGLDRPSAGTITVAGNDLRRLDEHQLADYRLNTVGFVWQNSARNLIPYLTAVENIELPMTLAKHRRRDRARELLAMVGLAHRERSRLDQLSGGEQQRVAIAIGLANDPPLLLADEPTGSVDSMTTTEIMEVFQTFNRELGVTIVIVTHDRQLSQNVDRVVAIRDGRTSSEFLRRSAYRDALEHDEQLQSADGIGSDDHEELVIVDKAGRLQLPKTEMERIGIKPASKVRITIEDDHFVVTAAAQPTADGDSKGVASDCETE